MRDDLRFEHAALSGILPRLRPERAASAFAAAMPCTDEVAPRSQAVLRRVVFSGLWPTILDRELGGDPAEPARAHLVSRGFPGAAEAEVRFDRPPRRAFAGTVGLHPELFSDWSAP